MRVGLKTRFVGRYAIEFEADGSLIAMLRFPAIADNARDDLRQKGCNRLPMFRRGSPISRSAGVLGTCIHITSNRRTRVNPHLTICILTGF